MPIDRTFRTTWKRIGEHHNHTIWATENSHNEVIHGTTVGVHFESCIGCMKCISACPTNVFVEWTTKDGNLVVDPLRENDCILCYACELVCTPNAIDIVRESGSQDTLDSLLRSG